ncbi:leukotoxin LktA family filamentous adhesin [Sulfitobacter sp. HGT1]|uniref:leukotoxin LktA family filamentous adhesin n=1 Tax=Sulfitobacter sp. HGT1 TaxID=2735435 RepID=UPI0015949FF2|nr:leukotoxin LktA family filamentous adhesin [Sulfitobacter sp. HGT1]
MDQFFKVSKQTIHPLRKTKTVGSKLARLMAGASPIVLGAVVTAVLPSGARAQAVNVGGLTSNNIVADGRTKTTIKVTGNHTKIRTDTVSAGVGFNTFSDFQEAAGQRVDLYVPDRAGSLVNIVSNGAVVINGELNSYKDGKIGGNIFFSNSNGFIVGQSGRVNVGSLTVNTPTKAFLDTIVRADGSINNAVANQLMRGEIPISPNGVISIAGQVTAEGGITLQGHTVMVNGRTGPLTGDDLGQRMIFGATVNSTGMEEGGALVSRGGQISIIAAGDATIGGRASVSAETSGRGGNISVKSGGNTLVQATAELSADGAGLDGDGGDIVFMAGHSLKTESGASFSARGAGFGNGGFIELSGKFAEIGAGRFDLGSDFGKAGDLLFDPIDLVIDGAGSILSFGATITLQADESITIASAGILDSTGGGGAAGSITLEAPKITLANGSTVTAGTTGDVTLTAVRTGGGTAEIIIGDGAGAAPILHGNNITLNATSTVDNFALLVAVPTATAKITINSGDIVATGALNANATATANGDLSTVALPVGVVVTNSAATVEVGGTSDITADSVALSAKSTVTSNIPTESLAPANSAADGAVAVSTINSTAIARITGDAKVKATNAIDVTAMNKILSVANATPQAAAFGASVGVSVINAITTTELSGNANVTAGSLNLDASTGVDVTVKAVAGAGGATEPSTGSQAATFLSGAKYGDDASTSEGKLSVAGALAISDLTSTTKSAYDSTTSATISGDLRVASSSENNVDVTADGTAVKSANGVGVAIGINIAKVKNDAIIASAVSAGSIHLSALSDNPLTSKIGNSFKTSSTSGAGSSNVGVAGSFALNLIDTQTTATIGAGVAVNITGGGAVEATTDNKTDSEVAATPASGGATGDTLGLGASVGLNIIANRSRAEVADGATVTGAGALTLSASATHDIITTAEAGGSGGFALTPVLALSMVNNSTTARLGTGSGLSTTGAVSVAAAQNASTTTTAKADAAGAKAAVGLSLALALVDDQVLSTTDRNVTTTGAGGTVTFSAIGASTSEVTSAASAQGAAAADDSGAAPAGGEADVDSAATTQLTSASNKQKSKGVGDTKQRGATDTALADGDSRSASTSEGKISVAAGVAINVQNATVSAIVPDATVISTAGMLTLRSASNATGKTTATGAAVGQKDAAGNTPDPSKVGIGAAVAVNSVKVKNDATLGVAAHTVGGLTVEALSLDVAKLMANPASTDTKSDEFLASATSGAGGSKVGVAGSLALNLIDTQSTARISSAASVAITGAGAVTLKADNQTTTTAEAKPVGGGASGSSFGIGASVGLNIIANRSVAELSDSATVTGAGAVSVDASAKHTVTTTAEAGSSGGFSLTPVLALSLVNNTTTARLGTGATLATTGAVSVSATQDSTVTTTAKAAAAGTKAAIGASLALALIDDRVLATTDRDVSAAGAASSVTFNAIGVSSSTLSATATASGAKEGDDANAAPTSTGDSVDKTATTKLTSASDKQGKAKVGSTDQRSATSTEAGNESGRSAKTSEGKVSAAAAVAVNVQKSSVTAVTNDGVNITSGGSLNISSASNANGSATSDGSAVKGADGGQSKVGIGVAVSVNVITAKNTAKLGQGTHSAAGVNIAALQGAATPTDTIFAKATSGAGGSKVGIAGSLALNIVNVETTASISGAASVDAKTGTSSIKAEEKMLATAIAAPSDKGGAGASVGVGASVALNLITTNTTAELQDGATFTNGTGLEVDANTDIDTVTDASAGAAGGIAVDASVALAMLDERTTARVGTGNGLGMGAGAVTISATNTGENTAKSKGENKSSKVSVGASAALILGNGASDGALENTSLTSAVLARDLTAGSLAISATSARTYDATASATAEGGKFNQTDEKKNETTGGTSTSANTMDKTKGSQRDSKGKSSGSKLTVAAAAGIAAAQDNVSATLGDVTLNVGGAVSVTASNQIGMATSGSGLAANPKSDTGIGIGVGLGIINNKTAATVSDGATINSPGSVSISATSRENADDGYGAKLTALGIAGATGKKVSIAGAMAVGISTGETKAAIGNNVKITNGGAVSVKTENTSHLAAKALAGAVGSSGTGIGASIAVVVADKDYTASIGTGSDITASGLSVKALNHKIDSPTLFKFTDLDDLKTKLTTGQLLGENNYYVEAIGGSAGSKTSITGSFAVMVFNDDVSATIGSGAINARNNDVTLQADNKFLAKALSGAISASGGTGVGVAGSVIVSSGTTISKLGDNAVVTNAARFTNSAIAAQDIQAFGVSVAAAANNAVNGVATVITSQNRAEALMGVGARVTASGAVNLIADNDFSMFSLAGGAAGGGSNGVGASAAVVTINNVTRAAMAAGTSVANRAEINTGGAIAISATANETGTVIAAAGAAGGSNAVGAGAAVYVLDTTTEALVGAFGKVGNAHNAGSLDMTARDVSTLLSIGGAASGGGSAGAGAGVGVGVIGKKTAAKIGASSVVASGNVVLDAKNVEDLSAITVGVGIGGSAGLAGAIAVYAVTTETTAEIGDTASVYADGNVAVLADDQVSIDMLDGAIAGGGSAGIGASVGVTVIDATTLAKVADNARVTALGNGGTQQFTTGYRGDFQAYGGSGGFQSADVGTRTASAGASQTGFDLLTKERKSVAILDAAKGVIVNASGVSSVRSMAVAGTAAGSVAVSISASVPVITMNTQAVIGLNAQINKMAGVADALQSVSVAAASDVYALGFSGAVAIGGSVGGGAGVNAMIVNSTTKATVGGGTSDIAAMDDILVSAKATEDFGIWAIAGSGGGVAAIAGSGSALDLTTETTATLGGTAVAQGNVDVLAQDITRTGMMAGSVAIGGTAGVGAAVGVILVDKTVTASIASSADVSAYGGNGTRDVFNGSGFGAKTASRGLNVQAESEQSALALVVSGAGGLYAGIAGVLSLDLVTVKTAAFIGANSKINVANGSGHAAQDVVIAARDSTTSSVAAGAVSGGLVGLSGAIDVGVFKTTTAGYVEDGVSINAKNDVLISGLSNKAGDSKVVSGSGGVFALAVGLSVYSYGDGVASGGEADKQLSDSSDGAADMDKVNTQAQDQAKNDVVFDLLKSSDDDRVKAINASAKAKRDTIDVASAASTLAVPGGTSASVGNVLINAGGDVSLNSSDELEVDITTGGFAAGGGAVGAGIAVLNVNTGSTAQAVGTGADVHGILPRITAGGGVNINAFSSHMLTGDSYAGTIAGTVALSADVIVVNDTSRTKAFADGQKMTVGGLVNVGADAKRTAKLKGFGAAVSLFGVGAGASVATATIGGAIDAYIKNSDIGAGAVTVSASSDDKATAEAIAASGGLGAAISGAATIATIDPTVTATVDNAILTAGNAVEVLATAKSEASTDSIGVAVAGGLAVGGSGADTTIATKAKASIINGANITAGSIKVAALTSTPSAKAKSLGAAGALVGLTATVSTAENKAETLANVTGSTLKATGLVNVDATSSTLQNADASGLALGFVAAGFNDSTAKSNTKTQATLTGLTSLKAGSLTVNANGTDDNTAVVVAGSGGLVAGSAASGTTRADSNTKAAIDGTFTADITGGDAQLSAAHLSKFGGTVDSTQASLIGGSGAAMKHTVVSDVDAHLGDGMRLYAANLTIDAQNRTVNPFAAGGAFNVNSASGGLANLPAGGATVTIHHNTTNASIGANSAVHLMTSGASALSTLKMSAMSDIVSQQKVKIDSGGAIALANADIKTGVISNTSLSVGDKAQVIVDKGDVVMNAWSAADIDNRAAATTYGLAGAPSGDIDVNYTGDNKVTIGANALLEVSDGVNPVDGTAPSHGTIAITAGQDEAGVDGQLNFNAVLDIFNKTAIPIPASPNPVVTVSSTGTVDILKSDPTLTEGVRAAGDITVSASRGEIDAKAVGTGKDIYREALAKVASAVSNAFGGGDVTFDYHGGTTHTNAGKSQITADGVIQTGIQRYKTLTLRYVDTSCDADASACLAADPGSNITYKAPVSAPVGTNILDRVAELDALLTDYASDPIAKAAYQSEITFLQSKLVDIGLGEFDGTGKYIPGDYAGPSPKAARLKEVAIIDDNISLVRNDLSAAAYLGIEGDYVDNANLTSTSYDDANFGLTKNGATTLTTISTITTYTGTGSQATFVNNTNTALTQGKAAADKIATAKANSVAAQGIITAKTTEISQQQAALAAALIVGDTTAATAASLAIGNAKNVIKSNLDTITANNLIVSAQSVVTKDRAATAQSNLTSLLNTTITASANNLAAAETNLTTVNAAAGSTAAQKTDALNARNTAQANHDANLAKQTALLQESATVPTQNGALTRVNKAAAGMVGVQTVLNTAVTAVNGKVSTLNAVTATPADATTPNKSLTQYITVWNGLSADYAVKSNEAATASNSSGTPTAFTIEINDAAARLGNLSFNADVLKSTATSAASSTGYLNAPGDAKIVIRNQTSNTLKLNNLIIPDYDAGNVRLNGVLVYDNDDITRLNAGGVAGNFKNIETSRNSSRGAVEIYSEYNTEDSDYYVPGSAKAQLANKRLAPDIILKTGAVIENTRGAVKIDSASGNIYIRGKINAGSVDILARNGDFVSSYVNGFNHIGGDPASFSDPKDATEAGKGITANGSVSIAARYLNINSTIQSGIANWKLDLDGAPKLTGAPELVGRTQAEINALVTANKNATVKELSKDLGGGLILSFVPVGIDPEELALVNAQYEGELAKNPDASPVRTLTIGGVATQVNIKDYLSGQIEGRLEFDKTFADNYTAANGGDGIFSVISTRPDNNIGASYDAKNKQYLVNGASVRGGYIQLFGQIMNTSDGAGKLNVLDGFGKIDITNTGNIPVVLKSLSTGEDPAGDLRGTKGKIEITDVIGVNVTDPTNPVVSIRKTTYEREYTPGATGGVVKSVSQTGTINNATGALVFTGGVVAKDGTDRDATFNPEANQRYVWTTGETFSKTSNYSKTSTELFGSSDLTVASINSLTLDSNPARLSIARLEDGTYVTTVNTKTGGGLTNKNGAYFQEPPSTISKNTDLANAGTQYTTANDTTFTKNEFENTGSSSRSCNWWTLCIVSEKTYYAKLTQEYTTITTESLRADYPIAVEFIGQDQGSINITSGSDVILDGNLTNVAGTTTITANGTESSIIQGTKNSLLSAQTAILNASGSVGGIKKPTDPVNAPGLALAVNLTGASAGNGYFTANAGNGNVSAISRGDIIAGHITAAGTATLDEATSRGNVSLVSFGSILASTSPALAGAGGSLVQGWRANLTALGGSIGETPDYDPATWDAAKESKLLRVNTGFTSDQSFRPFSETPQNAVLGLTAVATGDIGIRSGSWAGNTDGSTTDGTMLVNQALSLGGNVTLASKGQILDNNPVETIDTRTYNQLLGYWDSLGLLDKSTGRTVTDGAGVVQSVDAIGNNNALKQEQTIKAFENVKTKQYHQYWEIRQTQADPTVFDAAFTVKVDPTSAQHKALTSYYGDQIKAANPAYTTAQVDAEVALKISAYETEQTESYRKLDATVGSETGGVYVEGHKVGATTDERAQLTSGSVWTERELAFSIAPGALKTVTGTNPVIKDPNVSGRTVTILANKGIGETVKDSTGNLGVSIRSSLDPALLTPDQKVALAAAERTDLLLTITTAGGDVEIPLWEDYDTLSATQKAAFDAAAAGQVSPENTLLTVLSKRPLNFAAAEKLNLDVATAAGTDVKSDIGKAFLASRSGALLGAVTTKGETRIKVRNGITNAASGSMISTGNLILESSQGGIGTDTVPVRLALNAGATTTARAQNSVNLEFANGGAIDTIYSPQNVKLNALNGSLTNANGDLLINILGTEVELTAANGTIGAPGNALNVGVNPKGKITANAQGSIDLNGPSGSKFIVTEAKSTNGGDITLSAAGESVIDGVVDTAGAIILTAGGRQVLGQNAQVTSGAGAASVDAESLKMLNGAALTAAGKVAITTVGDAQLTAVKSSSGATDAVNIDAGGQVFAGTLAGRAFDISATTAGAGVKIVAGQGIGDKTRANETADDDTVTDVANPLRIVTGLLDASAANGSISVDALSDIKLTALTANQGGITVTGTGAMDIVNATAGGSQSFVAQDAVTFTKLTAAGLPTDVGNIGVTSVNGSVTGGDIDANGSSVINGNGVVFDTIMAGGDSTITSKAGAVSGTDITTTGSSEITGDGVTFNAIRTGVDSTITSTGDITGDTEIAIGDVTNTAGAGGLPGSLNIRVIGGRNLYLQATNELNLTDVQVADTIELRADKISAAVTQTPSGPSPLNMSLTGANDTVGTSAAVTVDAPAGIIVDDLKVVDTTLMTTATRTEIKNAYVPGSLLLTSPIQTIKVDNRTPVPQSGSNVQVFVPSFGFGLTLDDNTTSTNGIVVQYDTTSKLIDVLPTPLGGISLIRDTVRNIQQADDPLIRSFGSVAVDEEDTLDLAQFDGEVVVINGVEYMIFVRGSGPAVMLRVQ